MGLEHAGHVPLQDRPVVVEPTAYVVALGQVAACLRLVGPDSLPGQDHVSAIHQRQHDLFENDVALQLLGAELSLAAGEAAFP
ncbi:hypothetical protein D9M68_775910 [compost metagenome]